jgi:6-pyruvoyltetrahydropterin/6-carboxytetrahydropterin synthase
VTAYRLRLEKEALSFSSAHFLTFNAAKCARLHGHNYRVSVTAIGSANADGYVIDFADLKRITTSICAELDHRVLVPSATPDVEIDPAGDALEVRFCGKTYLFPREEVLLLPVPNTTAECLASWFGARLVQELAAGLDALPETIEVEIEESPGQSAGTSLSLGIATRKERTDGHAADEKEITASLRSRAYGR